MVTLLSKLFIKDRDKLHLPHVRQAYGVLCGAVGILLNVLLFAAKLFAGSLVGSIAITADAFNNLSDAGTSLITLIGFRLAGRKPNPAHPFGHGRIEYIAGLVVALAIVMTGFELGRSSLEKIINPEPIEFSWVAIVILALSVLTKLYMVRYGRGIGRKINSSAMKASAMDSLGDSIATTLVLFSTLLAHFTGVNIDGWCGMLVALFILYAGVSAVRETIDPLLGQPPEPQFVAQIEEIVTSHDNVLGIHDLIVHDYGPGRVMISLHAEVPATGDILELHDMIDNIEHELAGKLGCMATVHMDPIAHNDETVASERERVRGIVKGIDDQLDLHDFRMITGPTHTNLVFDVMVPHKYPLSDVELKERICEAVGGMDGRCYAIVKVDHPYV